MKILFLEDDDAKFDIVSEYVIEIVPDANIMRVKNWLDYSRAIASEKFDLILLDLLVPRSARDSRIEDHSESLVETTRDYCSKSFKTPAIVLTQHNLNEGDFVHDLNLVDINVISFNDHGKWREALKIKLMAAQPNKKFDVVILCALEKEALAFEGLTDTWGQVQTISGLVCREVVIGEYKAVIVRANHMGLVAAAVAASFALERFEPRLICMAGICGGVAGESDIYDLLVTKTCHQHDAGKWSSTGFKSEHYDVQLDVDVHNKLVEIASSPTMKSLQSHLDPATSEVPSGKERISCKIVPDAITSSGSAVIAEEGKTSTLVVGQRKLAGFDMEIYSVYEAARHARNRTAFFAAKAVVDDGGVNKGDSFHRIGCLLSAKFIIAAIREGISDVWKQ
ncbi:response regulator [Aeromonas sobria]|uniref:phosphorylase family protein n=1 Tax=Aeromonas sobria TaxID=646 RepID=UPI001115C119|nr:response regulator [Aeromonas sobria]TNH87246.1 response regulator [Aeromonas sobria]